MRRRFEGALGPTSTSSSSDELVALRLAHTDLHARLESERADAARAVTEAARMTRVAEGERDQTRLRCQHLTLELDRKDDQLRSALDAAKALRAELQRWRAAHEAARRHTDLLETDLAHANKDLIPTLTRNTDQLAERVRTAEAQANDVRQVADQMGHELAQTKQAMEVALAQNRDLQNRADRDRAELNRYRANHQVAEALVRAEHAQADAENRALKEQVAAMKAGCDALADELDQLRLAQADRANLEEQRHADQERYDALTRELSLTREDLGLVRQRAADLERDYAQMEKMQQRLERDRAEADQRAHDSEQRLRTTKESKASLKSDRSQLERQLHSLEVNMGSTSGRIQTLEDSLTHAQAAMKQVDADNQVLRHANDLLQADLDQSRAQADEIGHLQTQTDADLQAAKQKLTNLQDLMRDLLTTLKPARTAKTRRRAIIDASEILVVIEADIRRLQRELRAEFGVTKRPTQRQLLANQLEEKVRLAQRLRAPNKIVASPSGRRCYALGESLSSKLA